MDDLTQWQVEEAARRARDAFSLAETNGALDSAHMVAQTIESSGVAALINMIIDTRPKIELDSFLAAMMGTAEILGMIDTLNVGMALQIQATYSQMIAGLVGLQRQYAGSGASFELTWGEGSDDDNAIQERHLIVPSAATLALSEDARADVIKGSMSATMDDNRLSATAQVNALESINLQGGVGVSVGSSSLANLLGDTTTSDWTIARHQHSTGEIVLLFRAVGSAAIACLDDIESVGRTIFCGRLGSEPTHAALPSRKTAGRNPDPENDIAYTMILAGGNTPKAADSAFAYWCNAKGITAPKQRDRDAFKQAMKRKAERAQRNLLPDM